MANGKNGFVLYADQRVIVDELPDELAGKLFKLIFAYVNDEDPICDDLILKIAFAPIKQQLKRDLRKYLAICEKRKVSGTKGVKANATQSKQVLPNASKRGQLLSSASKSKQMTPDNDTDNDTDKKKKKKVYKKKKFIPPTLEEVKKYCKSRNNDVNPKRFFDFYQTADWFDSKGQKVANWKQKVITWEGRDDSRKPARSSTKPWVGEDYASKIHI